ncbi:MAG: hypothetical protein ACREPT_13735, partial [Rudaea sp.]
ARSCALSTPAHRSGPRLSRPARSDRPELLARMTPGKFSIVPTLRAAMRAGRIGGQRYQGIWVDIGTPRRLKELEAILP